MSIDSWDNLSAEQKRELCLHCEARNQIPGTYWTPFCLWWDEKRLHRQKLPGQDIYLAYDCTLKANGKPIKYDGAYCLDPTHPGVKAWITAECTYVIVINYSDTHMEGILPAKDLGKKKVGPIHELWLNSNIAPAGKGLPYSVPAYDARIYKFR